MSTDAPVFSEEWRAEHARRGDAILANLDGQLAAMGPMPAATVASVVALAQAHYTAASILPVNVEVVQ